MSFPAALEMERMSPRVPGSCFSRVTKAAYRGGVLLLLFVCIFVYLVVCLFGCCIFVYLFLYICIFGCLFVCLFVVVVVVVVVVYSPSRCH